MTVTRLRTADPATVFLSYSRTDREAVLPLESALLVRGARVLRDERSLELGAANVMALQSLIASGCDAIIFFVTHTSLESDFIWRYEIPEAIRRHEDDPDFHIIPVLQGVSFQELSDACADRGIRSLADFNAARLGMPGSGANAVAIAKRSASSALAVRLARAPRADAALHLCLRTFAYTPPAVSLDLDLDWTSFFGSGGPTPEQWETELLPGLEDVRDVAGSQVPSGDVAVWVQGRLVAALALGHAFPPKGAFRLRTCTDDPSWRSGQPAHADALLTLQAARRDSTEKSAIIEVAVSRDVTALVTEWRREQAMRPAWRLRFAPENGVGRGAVKDEPQARTWARQVGDEVRRLWDRERVREVHLFLASSAEFAALLGCELRGGKPVHVYFVGAVGGYRRAYTLSGTES